MHGEVRAPEINRPGLQWFNVARPLSLADLRGRIVILDFWTFCCINCMHILPILRRVEEAFPTEVAVIGVHSPKFTAERDAGNLQRAIARYGIVHPVVQDTGFRLWKAYTVRAWPTLMFLGPDGSVLGQHSGEPDPERLLQVIGKLVAQAKAAGDLRPSLLDLAPAKAAAGRLSFPGKMKPLAAGDGVAGWVIADGGHHQIVVVDSDGRERRRFGTGAPGFADGDGDSASFNNPQGLIAAPDHVYVADTGNHAIRRIDLADGRVITLAGTGQRGRALPMAAAAGETALASPWDLELDRHRLYFANAGTHQLGLIDLGRGSLHRLAGDSGEAIVDGPADEARLAQPSGLALSPDGTQLYFADSETSAVRTVTLEASPTVTTLVGTGLFDFGHRNGSFAEARLQHPLGIAWYDSKLLVADSYNGVIRLLDPRRGEVSDFDDGSYLCGDPICIPASEPAGVAVAGDRVFLVDTNNHRVLVYDPATKQYRTWFA